MTTATTTDRNANAARKLEHYLADLSEGREEQHMTNAMVMVDFLAHTFNVQPHKVVLVGRTHYMVRGVHTAKQPLYPSLVQFLQAAR